MLCDARSYVGSPTGGGHGRRQRRAGGERGTLAVRFLFSDATPKPVLRTVKLREALPPDTPHVGVEERAEVLSRRNRAPQRRYGY